MITAILFFFFYRITLWFMEFLKKAAIDSAPRTFINLTRSLSRAFFRPCDWMCCFIAEPPEWRINPPPTDHHLHRTWNYSAGPVWEMRSESREKHEITEMHFFFFFLPSQPRIWKLPSWLFYLICARCFTPPSKTPSSFLFSPPPCSTLSPLNVPGDFISPISNRIGTQFAMPHVTSCFRIPHSI